MSYVFIPIPTSLGGGTVFAHPVHGNKRDLRRFHVRRAASQTPLIRDEHFFNRVAGQPKSLQRFFLHFGLI